MGLKETGKEARKRALLPITGAFQTGGGIAAVNRLAIKALAEAGYSLEILALTEAETKVDARYVEPTRCQSRAFNGNKTAFANAVWKDAMSGAYDVILADHVNLASVLAPVSRLAGKPYAVWLFGMEVFAPRPDLEGRIGMRFAGRRLAISGFTQKAVQERFPKLAIQICDLALDPVQHPRELPKDPETRPVEISLLSIAGEMGSIGTEMILHVGRMVNGERYKGQETLIRAFPAIGSEFPQAQLVLAGEGPEYARLRQLAEDLPSEYHHRIFMPGYVAAELLPKLYQACFLFAMPSIGEGFGLVYLEAMAHAKPCLGGKVDATPYLVQDGVTGLLVEDPKLPGQAAEKILALLHNPAWARALGEAGYERVRSYYLFPHFKERFLKALFD